MLNIPQLLREIYSDQALIDSLDAEEQAYYTDTLERLSPDTVTLNGRRYWLDEDEAYQRWEDVA